MTPVDDNLAVFGLDGAEVAKALQGVVDRVLAVEDIGSFIELGGPVLVAVLAVTFLIWFFIVERILYLSVGFGWQLDRADRDWKQAVAMQGRRSGRWGLVSRRQALISVLESAAYRNSKAIKTLIALAPLFGLLGTVTGMLEVFDVIAITGSNNARTLAAGIAKATIPTMAGMVTAISGIYFHTVIQSLASRRMIAARNRIVLDDRSLT